MIIEQQFTKYEIARILGARALQIAMDAPLLIKLSKEDLENVRYDPLKIAEAELSSDVLPITVKRPMPKRAETKLKRETKVPEKVVEKKTEHVEEVEEKKVTEDGEIMELATPEDEVEEVAEEEAAAEE